ncbi:hypothetical protein SBRY_40550 [Actinacidiphila bryophytorum]|uniref:Uncharacterized protein n=1 Tax=Actinacidiphila bryophytorum TaxID=1436133 RepID=A0A9W4MIG8_9ACTN|nr:hypothetical protein SBRY_40550 [Actinacidiphila bryophytorum]
MLKSARGQHPRQPAALEPDQQRLPARARPADRCRTPAVGHVLGPRRAPERPGRRHRQARTRTRLRRRPVVKGARRRGRRRGRARPVRGPTRRGGRCDGSGPLPAGAGRCRAPPLRRRQLRPGVLRLRRAQLGAPAPGRPAGRTRPGPRRAPGVQRR